MEPETQEVEETAVGVKLIALKGDRLLVKRDEMESSAETILPSGIVTVNQYEAPPANTGVVVAISEQADVNLNGSNSFYNDLLDGHFKSSDAEKWDTVPGARITWLDGYGTETTVFGEPMLLIESAYVVGVIE